MDTASQGKSTMINQMEYLSLIVESSSSINIFGRSKTGQLLQRFGRNSSIES